MAGGNTELAAIDNVNTELNVMTQNLYGIENLCEIVGYAFKAAFNTVWIKELEIETNICVQNIQKIEYNLNDVNKSLEEAGEKTDKLSKADDKIGKMFKAAAGYISKIDVSKILNASDELVQTTTKLNMMNEDLLTTDQLTRKIYASAQNARGSYEGMTDFVTQMGMSSGDSFGSTEEIINFGNLLQKQMTIAGASTSEASAMMSQLAESAEAGVLGGDELSTIFQKMPNMVQSVAAYLEQPVEKVQKWASEGKITTNTLKNAMFASAEEINKKFKEMPMTWEQVGQMIHNSVQNNFQPVLQMINSMVNSEPFQTLVSGAIGALGIGANVVVSLLGVLGTVAGIVYDNWSIISPLIYGVIAAMGIYTLALGAYSVAQIISNVQEKIAEIQKYKSAKASIAESIAKNMAIDATAKNTVAQASFNTTLLASPITWVTLAVLAFVVGLVMLCNWIAKATGVTQSGFGIIAGVVGVVGAAIWNTIIGLLNGILQFAWTCFFEPVIGIMEFVLNAFSGGFDSFGGMVGNLMANVISWFLSFGKVATKVIDAVFGTDWTSELESLQDALLETGKTENAITLDNSMPTIGERISYGDAWEDASAWGDEKAGQLGNLFSSFEDEFLDPTQFMAEDYMADAGELEDNTAQIADNTASIKDSVDISNENLKYLRDIAERDAVNRFTTAQIKVAMTNNNNINNSMDLDGIINHLVNGVNEAMVQSAEGVNAYA